MDEVVDAAAGGDAAALDRGYRRLLTAGTPGSVIVGAAVRHFSFLQKARAAYDDGASTNDIVSRAAPPIFFSRRDRIARQIGGWSATAIDNALARLDRALYESRLYRTIEDEVVGQALHAVAAIAPRAR
jgi:DNA polymerase-3 subunit delta